MQRIISSAFLSAFFCAVLLCVATATRAAFVINAPTRTDIASQFLQAQFMERNGNFDEAAGAYEAALERHPKNPLLLERAFISLLLAGQFDRAAQRAAEYIQAVADTPENATRVIQNNSERSIAIQRAAYIRITDAIRNGEYDTAIQMLQPVQDWLNSNVMTNQNLQVHHTLHTLLLTWTYFAKDNHEQATTLLDDLALNESFLFYQDALMLYRQGQVDEARKAYHAIRTDDHPFIIMLGKRINKQQPVDKNQESGTAIFHLKNTDITLKDEEFPDLASLDIDQFTRTVIADMYHQLASILIRQHDFDEALFLQQLSTMLQPGHGYNHFSLGELAQKRAWHRQALRHFGAVDEQSGFFLRAQAKQALLRSSMGETQAAIDALRQLIHDYPHHRFAMLGLADLFLKEQNYEYAIRSYTSALATIQQQRGTLAREHWSILYARGIAYEQSDNWPKAERDFKEALRLYPDQPDVLNYLGYSWLVQETHLEEAELMLKKAIVQRPRDGHILDSYGWALYLIGEYERAAPFLERASTLLPTEPVINDHLGDLYWRLGRTLEARFQWERALRGEDVPDMNREATRQKLQHGLPSRTPTPSVSDQHSNVNAL